MGLRIVLFSKTPTRRNKVFASWSFLKRRRHRGLKGGLANERVFFQMIEPTSKDQRSSDESLR
ncbi:MAG: hypothetical protein ACRC10_12130 [Thermoguttaceae bacterium]